MPNAVKGMNINNLQSLGKAIGNGLSNVGNYTALAADRANGISFASQNAQGAFNQNSANIANALGSTRIAEQMGYNSAAWDRAAGWNEMMFERQMAFNAEEAQKQRDWMQMMESTKYQRAVNDMQTAGLNPVLAVTGGGISAGSGGGSAASVGAPTMSSTSSGLLNGISASEGNFQGQMEYMGGVLGLISAVLGGFSSAVQGLGSLGDFGEGLGAALGEALQNTYNNDKHDRFGIDWNNPLGIEKTGGGVLGWLSGTKDKAKNIAGSGYYGFYNGRKK